MSNATETNGDSGTTGTRGTVGIGAPRGVRQQRAHPCAREANGTTGTQQPEPAASDSATLQPAEPAEQATTQASSAEDQSTSAEVEPAPDPVLPEPAAPQVKRRHRLEGTVRQVGRQGRKLFTPPDLLHQRRPAWVERIRYARYGPNTAPGGGLQRWQIGYAYGISGPLGLVTGGIDWILERPLRAGVFLVSAIAVWLTPPGQAFAGVAAWLLHAFADLIVV